MQAPKRRPWQAPPPPPWGEGAIDLKERVTQGYTGMRRATRGLLLPMFTWPLLFDAVSEIVKGSTHGLVAALLGLFLPLLAAARIRRGRRGDTNKAAILTGVATGLVAGLGAGMTPVLAVLLGAGAWAGTRLLYDGAVVEIAPPEPPKPAAPDPLAETRIRLARIAAVPRLAGVAAAMGGVLDDLDDHPERLTDARRFLVVHLDGLDRIRERLEAGAEAPSGLPQLLNDLTDAAEDLRARLRAEETAALDIQVKVLSERLRQEGYA